MTLWYSIGVIVRLTYYSFFFFFNDTATTEIYTLSLHDALPISGEEHLDGEGGQQQPCTPAAAVERPDAGADEEDRRQQLDDRDRKSTRLNSSHANISYAVFCLKKKKNQTLHQCICFRLHEHHET